jgi:hypothetical protein
MQALATLGAFLILGFLVPGVINATVIFLFFPEMASFMKSGIELVGASFIVGPLFLVALLSGNFGHLAQHLLLDRIWRRLYPSYQLDQRQNLDFTRAAILTAAEQKQVSHDYFDQTFGLFVLFTNSSTFLILVTSAALLRNLFSRNLSPESAMTAVAILALSVVSLGFGSPIFRKWSLDSLDELKRPGW